MLFVHESVIPASPERIFEFHERPDALARLVPPWERVEVLQPPTSLAVGTVVRLRGPLGLTWVAEHTRYEPPSLFQDVQKSGPFRRWVHTHRFLPDPQGARLRDEVEWDLPLARLAAPFVERRLRRMFEYRHRVTREAVLAVGRAPGTVP